jgi:hypothetical protein
VECRDWNAISILVKAEFVENKLLRIYFYEKSGRRKKS